MVKTTARDLLKKLREDLQDLFDPFLWSDSELLRYLNEGQIEFCRQGIPLFDSSSAVTRIPVSNNEPRVPFDESILDLKNVFLIEMQGAVPFHRKLRIGTQDNFLALWPTYAHDYGVQRYPETLMHQQGEVFDVFIDYDSNHLYLAQVPNRSMDLQLSVERIPVDVIDDCDITIEVHRMHHPAILSWASYMAFLRQDSETFDERAASRFYNQFVDYATRAKDEKLKRFATPGTVIYGGI